MKVDTLILGAGPAGLSAAFSLLKMGKRVVIIEKDKIAGGQMRPVKKDDFSLDFGYKHLYNRIPEVHSFWKSLLGDNFIRYKPRIGVLFSARVFEKDKAFKGIRRGMPYHLLFAAFLDLLQQRLKYRNKEVKSLQDFAYSKRGRKLTMIFSQGYDERLKGHKWSQLSVPAIPDHQSSIDSNFLLRFYQEAYNYGGQQVQWFHPAKGTGQIVEELEKAIGAMGGKIYFESEVINLMHDGSRINSIEVQGKSGTTNYFPETVISSLPLNAMAKLMAIDFKPTASDLSFKRGVIMAYLFLNKEIRFPHTAIQISCPKLKMGRVTNYGAFGGSMVPVGKGCVCIEYFCFRNSKLFSASESELFEMAITECESAGLLFRNDCFDYLVFKNPEADPATSWEDYVTDTSRAKLYKDLEHFNNLYQINRTGTDKSTYAGLMAAKAIISKNKHRFVQQTRPDVFAPWESAV